MAIAAARTEGSKLNILVGLCVGHDSLFIKHSRAPSDVESIVRSKSYLTGEYQIIVDRNQHLDTLTVEIEADGKPEKEVQDIIGKEIKARLGVTANVIVLPVNTIPRTTHKAKRVIDRRTNVWE